MAGKRLTWVFELFDRMSARSKVISRHLETLDKRAKAAGKATEQLERRTKKAGDAASHAGRGMESFTTKLAGWVYLARSAIQIAGGLARGIGGLALGFVKAGVGAASFKESTMLGLNMMLRDKGLAKSVYSEAVNFADISPFDTQQTLQWYRMLTPSVGTQGVGTKGGSRVLKVLAGLGDIAAGSPDPGGTMDRLVLQVTQMLSKGRLQGEEFNVMAESGVNIGKVYERLSKLMGVPVDDLKGNKWQGKIPSGPALQAILGFSAEQYGGGVLGGGMGPASQTVQGLFSTLGSRPYRLMEDLGNTAGFKSMKAALSNLVAVLDPSTPAGARIKANIENLFDKILGGVFKQFEDPAKVEAFIKTLLDGFEKLIPRIAQMAESLGNLAASMGHVASVVGVIADPAGSWKQAFPGGQYEPVQLGHMGMVMERIKALRKLKAEGKLTKLGIGGDHSFGELNYWEGEANRLGIKVPEAPPPAASQSPGPTSMQFGPGAVQIHINGAQDPKAVGDEMENRLASVFERLAMQQGAAYG